MTGRTHKKSGAKARAGVVKIRLGANSPARQGEMSLRRWRSRQERIAKWNLTHEASRQETLHQLRHAFAAGETPLRGWEAIRNYLGFLGVRTNRGSVPSTVALWRWTRRLGFPVLRGSRSRYGPGRYGLPGSVPFTTSFILLAWFISRLESGGSPGNFFVRTGE